MTDSEQILLEKMEGHIAANLNNEQFGVEQLAGMIGMSRSHLHRKLQKIKGKSISRFIREYRLEIAHRMLLENEITASEVAHTVGFASSSYFNKCFTEYFGYSPGKTRLRAGQGIKAKTYSALAKRKHLLGTERFGLPFPFGFSVFSGNKKEAPESVIPFNEKSIIVLPFKNLSSDQENQYLADGMVDAISRHLSGIDELKVISSSASSNLNSIKEIGEKLGVARVIQGSLQRQDTIIRMEIKLLDTSDGSQIWARNYDRKVFDILEIQNDISKKIVHELEVNMSVEERLIIKKRTSYDSLAYDNYLKGMYSMNHFGDKKIDESFIYFEKAITIDSTIAPAYAAIANYYQMKASVFSATIDSKEAFKKAEHYLDIALKLDKDWHFNFTMKAFQLTFFHWNFEEANKNYEIGLKAKKPLNYIMYRDFLQFENRHEEALETSLIVDRETPFYPNSPLIMSCFYNGMYEQGQAFINEKLASFPKHHLVYDNSAFFMLNTGNYKRAIELFQRLIEIEGKRLPRIIGWMGAAYAKAGDTKKAMELSGELKQMKVSSDAGAPAFFIAIIHAALAEKEKALKWLKIAVDDHEMEIPWLVSEPQLYPLHGMPEFDALVKQVGFREHAYPVELPAQFQ